MKRLTSKAKSLLISCLFVVMAFCFSLTASLGVKAIATTDSSMITMKGASVRVSSTVQGEYGLRFETLIEKDELDAITRSSDFEVGMLYIPTDLVDGELTVDTSTVAKMVLTDKHSVETIDNVDYYHYKGYIRNMPAEEYDRQISARTYILNDGNYTYADTISRSTLQVARIDYEASDDNDDIINQLYFTPYTESKTTHVGSTTKGKTTLNEDNTLQISVGHYSTKLMNYAITQDAYGDGTYVMTEFKGVNMPSTVFFGVTNIGALGFTEDLASDAAYASMELSGVGVYANMQTGSTRYVYRDGETIVNKGYKTMWNNGCLSNPNTVHYPDSTDNPNKTFVLIVGASTVTDGVSIEQILLEKDTDTNELISLEKYTQVLSGAELKTGPILFGSGMKNGVNSNFKLYTPDTRENILNKLNDVYGFEYKESEISASDFTLSTTSASVTTSDNGTFNTTADDYYNISVPFGSATKHNYAYTNDTYQSGTYVLAEFQGQYFPTKITFGSEEVTDGTITTTSSKTEFASTGVTICGDENATSYAYYKTSENKTSAVTRNNFSGNYCRGWVRGTATTAYTEDITGNATATFILLAGAYNYDESVVVEYTMFRKYADGTTFDIVQTKKLTISNATLDEGHIVFATSVNVSYTMQFKLYQPDTKENLLNIITDVYGYEDISGASFEFSHKDYSATDVKNGLVTVKVAGNVYTHHYAKTLSKYAPGTYMLMEFTGSSYPANIFFGSNVVNTEAVDSDIYTSGIDGFCITTDGNFGTGAYTYVDGERKTGTSSDNDIGLFDRGYLYATNCDEFGLTDLGITNKDTTWQARSYVMLVGAVQVDANVKLEYTLYLNEDGTLTELQTKDFVFTGYTLETGSIVFSNTIKTGHTANFNLYTPDTKANLTTLMNSLYTFASAE